MGSAAVIHEKQVLPLNLSGRVPELDGIRGIAIGMVLIAHFFLVVSRPGSPLAYALVPLRLDWSGVDLFFVLSGFLIGGILLDARESPKYFQVFYMRRVHRILSIYYLWVSLFVVLEFGASRWLPAPLMVSADSFHALPFYYL